MTTPAIKPEKTGKRHRFTVDEYFALSSLGVLPERTELIEGDIYDMSAHSPRHRKVVNIATDNLKAPLKGRATIFSQSTLASEGWSPEPDIMVLEYDPDQYGDRQPTAGEIHLIIEVADTTLARDKGIKLRSYAREGIGEYWVVKLVDNVIEVYRQPRGEDFDAKTTYGREAAIAPQAFPGMKRVWLELEAP